MGDYKEYQDLLLKNYDEAVDFLLQKYGSAQDNYFKEKSYKRFMNEEIKGIGKGNISRTREGLYCHHIDENIMPKISDPVFIREYKIPFEYQKKERLVYCDLIEHSILHVLIAKETSSKFGYLGFIFYLSSNIEEWYLDEMIPYKEWEKNCYKKSFLVPQEAFDILNTMHNMIGENYYESLSGYYEEQTRIKEERERLEEEREEKRKEEIKQREQYRKKERIKLIDKAKLLHDKSPRKDIVFIAYKIKYSDIFDEFGERQSKDMDFKKFDSEMKKYPKHKILEGLNMYLDSL